MAQLAETEENPEVAELRELLAELNHEQLVELLARAREVVEARR